MKNFIATSRYPSALNALNSDFKHSYSTHVLNLIQCGFQPVPGNLSGDDSVFPSWSCTAVVFNSIHIFSARHLKVGAGTTHFVNI